MLQKATVELSTLELLKNLQSEPLLKNFNLVGGTALALRIGHRKSVDLDLFTNKDCTKRHKNKRFYRYCDIAYSILIRRNIAILCNEISKFKCNNTNKRFNIFR